MRIARESLLLLGFLAGPMAAGAADDGEFRTRVAPIFEARCVRCHGPEKPKGGLSLATARGLLAGGDGGPAVVPGRPEESLLLEMIAGPAPEMPRGGDPLPAEAVATIRHWIEQGAPWPEGLVLKSARSGAGPWWSLTPLARPEIPRVHAADRVRAPIDAFLLKALEAKGLAFGPEADRRTLIRRLSFDLTGLPPTPEEVDGFLHDTAPDAYERLVERLLASPHYGERWARHWLDVVHYGDTHGYDKDKPRRNAWPYRDYVIGALNADRPYARFIREQIAGDVLSPDDPQAIIATGFVAAGPWDFVGQTELREGTVDKAKARLLDRDDMVATTMSTFVSLTVHCARCHDHKFDPIPQADYYRLQAVFAGVDRGDRPWMTRAMMEQRTALDARKRAIAARLVALQRRADAVTSLDLVRLDGELEAMRNRRAALPAPVVDTPSPTNGYHSGISPAPDVTKWVQVDLGAAVPIGAIRLVPARPTDFPDTPGFGFPVRFRVELAEDATFANAAVVADHATADVANPGDEPYVVTPIGHRARFVRITATRLWPRRGDYVFALGELEVLSGGRNVAAGCKVTAPDSIEAGRWSTRALVDGHDSRHRLADRSDPEV
ncbi:MAG TPA: DUF1549 domain-containing protein, partial [Isosphaeraceae bacterium]